MGGGDCGVPDKELSSQLTYRVWMLHTLVYLIAVGKVPGVPEPLPSGNYVVESSWHERWQMIVGKVVQNGCQSVLDGLWCWRCDI